MGSTPDFIWKLENASGRKIQGSQAILNECFTFYNQLYTKPPHTAHDSPRLQDIFLKHIPVGKMSLDHFQQLDQELTVQELYVALTKMKLDVSPGEDGLTVEFYWRFWPIIANMVFQSLQQAQRLQCMSPSQCRGLL